MGDRVRLLPDEETAPLPAPVPEDMVRWKAPFERRGPGVFDILLTAGAFEACCQHASSDMEHEVGGGLVGTWHIDPESGREHILIEGVIPARFTAFGKAHLTFTQDTLVDIQARLEEYFPGARLVGWFHTHPKMSVFLSGYDLWLHHHFFPEAWQVALVIEPHSHTAGFFKRQHDGGIDPHRYEGFYEIVEEGRSIVTWNNMTRAGELAGGRTNGGQDE